MLTDSIRTPLPPYPNYTTHPVPLATSTTDDGVIVEHRVAPRTSGRNAGPCVAFLVTLATTFVLLWWRIPLSESSASHPTNHAWPSQTTKGLLAGAWLLLVISRWSVLYRKFQVRVPGHHPRASGPCSVHIRAHAGGRTSFGVEIRRNCRHTYRAAGASALSVMRCVRLGRRWADYDALQTEVCADGPESVTPLPGLGVQLATTRGFKMGAGAWPLSTSRQFVPLADVTTVVIHEGLRRWSVRYYLAVVRRKGPVVVVFDVSFFQLSEADGRM